MPAGRGPRHRQPQGCARRVGGSILVARLMKRGVAGVVTDGGFRDSQEIAQLAIPAFHHRPAAPTNLTAASGARPQRADRMRRRTGLSRRRHRRRWRGRRRHSGASCRRTCRRGRRNDGVRGLRHRGGDEGALDPRPLSGDRRADDERLRGWRVRRGLGARARVAFAATRSWRRPRSTLKGPAQSAAGEFLADDGSHTSEAAEDINPSNTGDIVGLFARADATATGRAIAAAKAAFPAWSRGSIQQRHDILKRIGDEIVARKDELGRLLAREEGKTLAEGVGGARTRRPDLPVLRRRMREAGRREFASVRRDPGGGHARRPPSHLPGVDPGHAGWGLARDGQGTGRALLPRRPRPGLRPLLRA